MAMVSVSRDRIRSGTLPAVCAVCGESAAHRRYPGVAGQTVSWLFYPPLLGPVAFWIFAAVASTAAGRGGIPFCDRHRSYWLRRGVYLTAGLVATVALISLGVILAPPMPTGRHEKPPGLYLIIGLWVLGFAAAFMIVNGWSVRPIGGNRRALVVGEVSRRFAGAVEGRKVGPTPPPSAAPRGAPTRPGAKHPTR